MLSTFEIVSGLCAGFVSSARLWRSRRVTHFGASALRHFHDGRELFHPRRAPVVHLRQPPLRPQRLRGRVAHLVRGSRQRKVTDADAEASRPCTLASLRVSPAPPSGTRRTSSATSPAKFMLSRARTPGASCGSCGREDGRGDGDDVSVTRSFHDAPLAAQAWLCDRDGPRAPARQRAHALSQPRARRAGARRGGPRHRQPRRPPPRRGRCVQAGDPCLLARTVQFNPSRARPPLYSSSSPTVSSMADVRTFAREWNATGRPIHVLVNNAGVMPAERELTPDGLEVSFGTMLGGTYLLTALLLPVRVLPRALRLHVVARGVLTSRPPRASRRRSTRGPRRG